MGECATKAGMVCLGRAAADGRRVVSGLARGAE